MNAASLANILLSPVKPSGAANARVLKRGLTGSGNAPIAFRIRLYEIFRNSLNHPYAWRIQLARLRLRVCW
jgi:hypothetical protein